jgi:hypothetical protein
VLVGFASREAKSSRNQGLGIGGRKAIVTFFCLMRAGVDFAGVFSQQE